MPSELPAWVKPAMPISSEDRQRLLPIARSWIQLSKNLGTLSETDLLKIMVLELDGAKRPVILSRCLMRFRVKRVSRENKELFEYAADLASAVIAPKKK